jgi:hypothetical protein
MQFAVQGALEKVRQTTLKGVSSQSTVSYLNCAGRHPPDESGFDATFVRTMADRHAILELWGTLFDAGANNYTFDIHYVMFPVAVLGPPSPSGITSTEQQMASRPTPDAVKQYFVSTRADLPTYFTLAAGVQAFQDANWDQAIRYLCQARTRLKGKAQHAELMKLADQFAAKAATETRKAPDANGVALLTEAQARDYCAFATTR